jgi:hypothetical protein
MRNTPVIVGRLGKNGKPYASRKFTDLLPDEEEEPYVLDCKDFFILVTKHAMSLHLSKEALATVLRDKLPSLIYGEVEEGQDINEVAKAHGAIFEKFFPPAPIIL